MRYEKPQILEQASAIHAVQSSSQKQAIPIESDDMQTVSAYQADEA